MHQLHSTTRSTTTSHRGRTTIAAAAAALALTAALTGCATGGSGSAASASATSSSASHALPANFPKAVPIVSGDVVLARGNANEGWSATIAPKGDTGFAKAEAALASAGFTKQAGGSATRATYTNDHYTVGITTPGSSVTYIISTR
jgi:hypothetical protein